jgi:malonyl-CoA/methylmalonyl-CoA synthetase
VGDDPSATLLDLLRERAPADTARAFLTTPDGATWTYADLDDGAARMAAVLRDHGVRVGDRVAVQVPKTPAAVVLHVALLRVGAVQLPMNPTYTDDEVAYLLADATPVLVVDDAARPVPPGPYATLSLDAQGGGTLAVAAAVATPDRATADVGPDDGAALLYTSGTTGRPKGALLSHRNLAHNARVLVDSWGFTGDDVLLHVLPLHHTHGLFVAVHCALASGSQLVLCKAFDPVEVVRLLPSCSVLMGVPTHYVRLVATPGFDATATAGLRLMVSGSAPMTVAVHEAVRAATGQTVLERYGMTETSMLTSNPLHGVRKVGTVGPPLPGVGVRVVADDGTAVPAGTIGAVEVTGPNVFAGYLNRPELRDTEFTADGWFRTGDLGSLDADGYLTLTGRAKDLVISGGLNVYPKEVETVLDALPGVDESAVVGLPDEDLGEAVVAVVVPLAGALLDAEALRLACRERLAGYKVPKRVVVVDALPRNTMGKVEKARLRATLGSS